MRNYIMLLLLSCCILFTTSCKTNNNKNVNVEQTVVVPEFNADSAYQFIQKQVDFGPRVPNTPAHVAAGEYLAQKLKEFGAEVTNQYVDLTAYDGTILKARNIIGSYNPEHKKRILLFAHWDSRPWADNDPDPKNHHTPVIAANDGASGVGVLLEIARQINLESPRLGIDIAFFDAEDYGAHQEYTGQANNDWALGSQYWSRYPHVEGYNARFGILFDMVGGKQTTFYREGYSEKYASNINKKVWKAARELGYSQFFVDEKTGYVTDDHVPVNEIARIPSIDIVPNIINPGLPLYSENTSFGNFWHTVHDDMSIIDKATLKAVGQTALKVIYNEK